MICVDLWVHPAQILQGQPARTLAMAEASRRHELRAARVHHKVVLAPPNGGVPDAVRRLIDGVFEAKMLTSVKTYIAGGDVNSFDNWVLPQDHWICYIPDCTEFSTEKSQGGGMLVFNRWFVLSLGEPGYKRGSGGEIKSISWPLLCGDEYIVEEGPFRAPLTAHIAYE